MSGSETAAGTPGVRVLTTLSELDAAAAEWRALWGRCEGVRTPSLCFEWVHLWCEHFAQDGRLHVVLVEQGGAVVGIAPLFRTAYRLGPFRLEALETIGGESRNLIALVEPAAGGLVARALAEHLALEALTARRLLRLSLVPSEHPFVHELLQAFDACAPGIAAEIRKCNVAPFVPLPAVWEDYEKSLGKRRRAIVRRASAALERHHRSVTVRRHLGDGVVEPMHELFRLHQVRWREAGVRGLFESERNREFHLNIARECDRLGWLDLTSLEVGGRPTSVCFNVVLDGVVYVMRSGRDTSFAEYSVGHIHDSRLFRRWIAEGRREVDFLRGAEPYKFYWTRRYRRYVELIAARAGGASGIPLPVARAWIALSRFLSHRHPPRELLYYLRLRWAIPRELRQMGIDLRQ